MRGVTFVVDTRIVPRRHLERDSVTVNTPHTDLAHLQQTESLALLCVRPHVFFFNTHITPKQRMPVAVQYRLGPAGDSLTGACKKHEDTRHLLQEMTRPDAEATGGRVYPTHYVLNILSG